MVINKNIAVIKSLTIEKKRLIVLTIEIIILKLNVFCRVNLVSRFK